jgi:hypothetical protein
MKIYNFYNFLEVKFEYNGHRGYDRYFDNEYLRITGDNRSTNKSIPIITVKIVDELPNPQESDIVRTTLYKKLFHYSYLVREIHSNKVEIFFKTHYIDKLYMNAIGVFLQAQVLEPVMYLKLLEEDILFMHAGGVAKDGKGYLLPAYGGTGKTTFSIALMSQGFDLLGDDLLIVDTKNQIAYPYLRPLHLFTYNINNLNGTHVPVKYKTAIYTKNVLRKILEVLLQTEFLISTRVHLDEIFSGNLAAVPVRYKGIYFLRKTGESNTSKSITKLNSGDVAEEIMQSEDLNDSLYELLGDREEIQKTKILENAVISNLLRQFTKITYVNTRKLDLSSKNITKLIEENPGLK